MNTITPHLLARDAAAQEAATLTAQIAKLEGALQKASPAVIELNQLREDAAISAAAWDGEGELPQADHVRERRLADEVAAFESSKRSAQAGIQTLEHRLGVARIAQAEAQVRAEVQAVLQLASEVDAPIVEDIRAAAKKFHDLFETRETFRKFVLTQANVHNSQELHRAHEQLLAVNLNLPSIGTADLTDINKRLAALLTLDA